MKKLTLGIWSAIVTGALMLAACSPAGFLPATPTVSVQPSPEQPVQAPVDPSQPVTGEPGAGLPGQPSPLKPRAEDETLTRGAAFIDEAQLLIRETYPPQPVVLLSGSLPTPCHELRIDVSPPDEEGKIVIEAYSVADPDAICAQVLAPFEESVVLDGLASGSYSVWIEGRQIGQFDMP